MWCSDQPVHCSNKDLRRERHITESATLRTTLTCSLRAKAYETYSTETTFRRSRRNR
jgi:hypothetical protein